MIPGVLSDLSPYCLIRLFHTDIISKSSTPTIGYTSKAAETIKATIKTLMITSIKRYNYVGVHCLHCFCKINVFSVDLKTI